MYRQASAASACCTRLGEKPWPTVVLPAGRGTLTFADVLAAQPGAARDAKITDWCPDVWGAYHANHAAIANLSAERLHI